MYSDILERNIIFKTVYNCTGVSFNQENTLFKMTIFTMISHIAIRTCQTHNVTYFRTWINQSNSYLPKMLTERNGDRILTDLFAVTDPNSLPN